MKAVAVIPARYTSSRFPGKPLVSLAGLPMIQRVYQRASKTRGIAQIIVATDDERILQAVQQFHGEAVMTRPDHRSGTERVAEVAARVPADIYLNVQGDEPLLDPAALEAGIAEMKSDPQVQVATLCHAIRSAEHLMSPNVVKVVLDFQGDALYFSRSPIPFVRQDSRVTETHHWKHIGVYLFRRQALLDFPTLPPGDLEALEQLEQLRWLENGYKIRVVETSYDSISVDVPEDVSRVEALLKADSASLV